MKLGDALDLIDSLTDDDVFFAKRPWHAGSEALISQLDERFAVPKSIAAEGFSYFLDVPAAREALEVFGSRKPAAPERRDLLLHYGEYNAFPAWVYET